MNGDPYTERAFLTGADPFAIGFEKMYRILELKKPTVLDTLLMK